MTADENPRLGVVARRRPRHGQGDRTALPRPAMSSSVDAARDALAATFAELGAPHRHRWRRLCLELLARVCEQAVEASGGLRCFVANAGIIGRTEHRATGGPRGQPARRQPHGRLPRRSACRSGHATRRAASWRPARSVGPLGFGGRAAYGASKAGINGLVWALAVEWGPLGIRVNAVAPARSAPSSPPR
jgi:NAD(P)-dependent dehydrogenase (short-subunit alcohol dehydrogenase family)